MLINEILLDDLIKRCLVEDIGTGDVTTNAIVSKDDKSSAVIESKEEGIVAGLFVAKRVFEILSPHIEFKALVEEGSKVKPKANIAEVRGDTRAILMGERLALNFLQRLSGIATKTFNFVQLIAMYPARIIDTRKTTPGLRMLEKYAVRVGGGHNHRFGLYDAVLIKDNHIKAAGSILEAVNRVRRYNHLMKIEVEVKDLEQLEEALSVNVDIIMLDNMDIDLMKEAVSIVSGKALIEASGGISEENVLAVAKTGVDLISVGGLTHSARALDMSLNIIV
ncbi:carboxylating nicotinate-nucleotide diphosphorylase [Peptococcaceae bacterium]|nr:carboxylating nicotinate-nucleotide diphosphorylase [Peptococcaceae bacterium]